MSFARFTAGAFLMLVQSQAAFPVENRLASWQQDLKVFEEQFGGHQKDFDKLYPGLHDQIAELRSNIGKLSDAEIELQLMKMVASANIGHNVVFPPPTIRPLPLTLGWYSDGLAVIGAAPDYAAALGTHVVRIGSMTPDQLLAGVAPYIGHENETALRARSAGLMKMASLLEHVGAADASDSVLLTLAKPGGQPFTLAIAPGLKAKQVSMFEELHVPTALYRKQLDRYYWYEYLADSDALYIQYNRCENDPKLKFADFARGLFAFADAHPVKRVIVDLRLNGGGDSRVIGALKNGLKARAALRSHVFVLIGPGTFSSAQMAGIEFRKEMRATLVGEATGEKLNGYGEVKVLKLPNSGLRMQYSTKFFRLAKDDADALEPDIRVTRSLPDALAGRDPVLEAALKQ